MAGQPIFIDVVPSDKLTFVGDPVNGFKAPLRITSRSITKIAFKIKCTRNDLFYIEPAMGSLVRNQTEIIDIRFKPNGDFDANKLFVGVYQIPLPETSTCEDAWAEHYGPAQEEVRLHVTFSEKK